MELVDLARELEGGDHGRRPVAWVNGARRQLRVSEAEWLLVLFQFNLLFALYQSSSSNCNLKLKLPA